MYVHKCTYIYGTAISTIFEGRFQVFQRFSRSKLVLKTVKSRFVALNYYGNGSMEHHYLLAGEYTIPVCVRACECVSMYVCIYVLIHIYD
jgi:hypothetical protein